jgi:3-hydroxybutyryl-CoA dehydrogenase
MSSSAKLSFIIIDTGNSRAFGKSDPFRNQARSSASDVAIVLGTDITRGLIQIAQASFVTVLVELQTECLSAHVPDNFGREGGNVIGFSRYRLGNSTLTNLVELVVQPETEESAKSAAIAVFESAGLNPVMCRDMPGRIVDRLIRPYFNQALAALDDGLADSDQLDRALMLGLGYRRGPIDLMRESGLEDHFHVTDAIYRATGDVAYLPARRAQSAVDRRRREVRT